MQRITTHLWFDKQAREAAEWYCSVIPGSKVGSVTNLKGTPSGDAHVVSFELAGTPFMAISAGPLFRFNPSVSFQLRCGAKKEVDAIWERLSPGGNVMMPLDSYAFSERFGWVQDRYGVSWQIMYEEGVAGPKLAPFLMFVGAVCGKAEEAIRFYESVFHGAPGAPKGDAEAQILSRYGKGEAPDREGTVRYARFSLAGREFAAMDSAHEHQFQFNEAISFLVPCDTQQEIDYFWEKLSSVPKAEQCGWLKDRYGVSWQVAPAVLGQLLSGDPERAGRVTKAFLQMKKFDIAALEKAAAGK
jgi:predicted 3-demethylubiquinone-9 3-methyltransferase (glyoxalase superfamily)